MTQRRWIFTGVSRTIVYHLTQQLATSGCNAQPNRSDLVVTTTGQVVKRDVPQVPFLLRAIYFLLIGWWFSAIWLLVAWALHVSIIGMLVGFWMFNRVPAVVSLAR